jgi:replicative DNA helicase
MGDTFMSLKEYNGKDKIILSPDMKKLIASRPQARFKISTGLKEVDKAVGNFRSADLITITGTTGNGKTLLARTISWQMFKNSEMSAWFCFENLMEDFLESFGKVMPIFALPSMLECYKPDWLHTRIREAKEKYNVKVVFIDHLHFILDIFTMKQPSLGIGKVLRDLKNLAKELQIAIVMIAHTTKVKMDSADTELDLADIRDSSFIAQESDTCLLIWRVQEENGAILKVGKARHTGVMNKKIKLYKGFDGFLREAHDYE